MKKIVLVRHGESEGNAKGIFTGWLDVGLTDNGRNQAEALYQRLESENFDAVYSSDLIRAYETAQLAWDEKRMPIKRDEQLREKHFGALEGLKFDEISKRYPEIVDAWKNSDYNFPIPDGESFQAFYNRVIERYEKIKDSKEQRVLIFAHSGVIQAILAYEIVGHIRGCWRFKIENCRLTTLEISDGYAFIKKLNG